MAKGADKSVDEGIVNTQMAQKAAASKSGDGDKKKEKSSIPQFKSFKKDFDEKVTDGKGKFKDLHKSIKGLFNAGLIMQMMLLH